MTSCPRSASRTACTRRWFGSLVAASVTSGAASTIRVVAESPQQLLFGNAADIGAVARDHAGQLEVAVGLLRLFERGQAFSDHLGPAAAPGPRQPRQPLSVLLGQVHAGLPHLHG